MRLGDTLNGYRILTAPTNAGGGMSQWSFAEKDGAPYFVKMFLAPKFPLDDGPGSPESKARKRAVCIAFEHRHLEIAGRLDPNMPGGGNLVVTRDFFRVDSTYVKVMDRIEAAPLPPAHVLTPHQLMVILRTLVFSLRVLHDKHVVHGDIKPDNVLVQQTGTDLYVSKLIDFDEAYVVGQPPAPEHVVGDPGYYSPELLRYIKRDPAISGGELSTASDMFSLGLLLHSFLTGDVPAFDRSVVNYPAEAVLAGLAFDLTGAPVSIQPLLARLLARIPAARPGVEAVVEFLAAVDPPSLVPTGPPKPRHRPVRSAGAPPTPTAVRHPGAGAATLPAPAARPPRPSTVRSALTAEPAGPPADPTPESGLRSTMGRRRPRPET